MKEFNEIVIDGEKITIEDINQLISPSTDLKRALGAEKAILLTNILLSGKITIEEYEEYTDQYLGNEGMEDVIYVSDLIKFIEIISKNLRLNIEYQFLPTISHQAFLEDEERRAVEGYPFQIKWNIVTRGSKIHDQSRDTILWSLDTLPEYLIAYHTLHEQPYYVIPMLTEEEKENFISSMKRFLEYYYLENTNNKKARNA